MRTGVVLPWAPWVAATRQRWRPVQRRGCFDDHAQLHCSTAAGGCLHNHARMPLDVESCWSTAAMARLVEPTTKNRTPKKSCYHLWTWIGHAATRCHCRWAPHHWQHSGWMHTAAPAPASQKVRQHCVFRWASSPSFVALRYPWLQVLTWACTGRLHATPVLWRDCRPRSWGDQC